MPENLLQHRGEPNVWERTESRFSLRACDTERWLASVSASALLAWGFRERSTTGLFVAMTGAALAWWATRGREERRGRRVRLQERWRQSGSSDVVHEAAEESFPASDAPSWTPTIGNVGARTRP